MSVSAATAFGRYLHVVRERRGLTLQEVEDRALAAGHRIDKGSLSRFERGRQRLPVPSLLPLGRIYGVPFEALLERLELDHDAGQLELVEGADPRYEALARLGRRALLRRSRELEAYAYYRDAQDVLRAGRADRARASLDVATVARSLGKNRYALHELLQLRSDASLDGGLLAMVLDRLGNCYRCLGHTDRAERCLEESVAVATSANDLSVLAYTYYSLGALEHDRGAWERSLELLARAQRVHREADPTTGAARPNPTFEVEVLLKMADAQLRRGALDTSGRLALAARRLAAGRQYEAGLGYAEIQLGEVHERAGHDARALDHWSRAVELGRAIANRRLEFVAEFYRFGQMQKAGNPSLARASRGNLERLAPWCPDHLKEVAEFRGLSNGQDRRGSPRPAARQIRRELEGDG